MKTGYFTQALSPVGRCKSFEASADGYGRGEGFNAIVMQAAGLSGGDLTLALIQGSAVNQDGRSSSLTAPNGPAQQVHAHAGLLPLETFFLHMHKQLDLEKGSHTAPISRAPMQALVGIAVRSGSLSAEDISYVAVHGTGTPLGDPIEVGALAAALAPDGSQMSRAVALGSVKVWDLGSNCTPVELHHSARQSTCLCTLLHPRSAKVLSFCVSVPSVCSDAQWYCRPAMATQRALQALPASCLPCKV